mgnify:FL=1
MIYIKHIQTHTKDSVLGFKGKEVAVVGEFENVSAWLVWLRAINGPDSNSDFDLPYVVSDFERVKNLAGDAL